MGTKQSTRAARRKPVPVPTRPDAFSDLLRRLLVSVNQLQLAAKDFGDLSSLPREHVPAGLVVCETTNDLDTLYNDLDRWHVNHEHTAKGAQS
jgi:hypothetical protein